MREDKSYLKWCMEQNRGIRATKPSENIAKAYLHKTRNALKSMEVNAEAGLTDWTISASYYAKYFAVYALLTRIGIKSEIHDCTIALFEYLFGNDVPPQIIQQLRQSKQERIETQYYTRAVTVDLGKTLGQTRAFTLEIERIIDGLTQERITSYQNKIRELTKKP
jgi:uncharacterized protein (UPF0332 family)